MLTPSELKLEGFNSCPGSKAVAKAFDLIVRQGPLNNKELTLNYVDYSDERYWLNAEDTVVFSLTNEKPLSLQSLVLFSKAIADLRPDDFDVRWIENKQQLPVFRLWWD